MATKATPDDVKDLGFTFEMFRGRVANDNDFTVYIQKILDRNVSMVKDAIGTAAYDDTGKVEDVKAIETYFAAAELCKRRATIVNAQAVPQGPTGEKERLLAVDYEEDAWKRIYRLQGRPDIASSVQTSSHFAQDT